MNRRSIVFIFSITLFVAAGLQSRFEMKAAYSKNFELVQKKKEQNIALLSSMAESLFLTGRKDIVEGHLKDAIQVRWIDFYVLTYRGEIVSIGSIRKISDQALATLLQKQPNNVLLSFDSEFEAKSSIRSDRSRQPASERGRSIENFRFMVTDLGGDWSLKVGINMDREAFFEELDNLMADENTRLFVMGFLLTIAVFLFVSRDLRSAAKNIARRRAFNAGSSYSTSSKALSAEAEALRLGIEGYESEVGQLRNEKQRLSAQVLPSLKEEIQSGRRPPYDFASTLVRTDINSFSQIFAQYPTEEFLGFINEFFVECSHIISRYDGLIHEFVGDEIIFYFKDHSGTNSFTRALRCISEINLAAEQVHRKTTQGPGYSFRVKSSLAHGRLRFGPLLNGFSIAGAPLIETTRILGAVTEKNENSVVFDSSHLPRLHDGVRFRDAFRVHLKGLEDERRVLRYDGHVELTEVLTKPELFAVAGSDYRSISDWKQLVDHCVKEAVSGSHDIQEAFVKNLAAIHTTRFDESLVSAILNAISQLISMQQNSPNNILSAFIGALGRIHAERWLAASAAFRDLIAVLLNSSSPQVLSETIGLLFEMKAKGSTKISETLIARAHSHKKHQDPKVRASVAVLLSADEIHSEALRLLRGLIDSDDRNAHLSAGDAILRIQNHFKDFDPVYLRTQVEFQRLANRSFERAGTKGAA